MTRFRSVTPAARADRTNVLVRILCDRRPPWIVRSFVEERPADRDPLADLASARPEGLAWIVSERLVGTRSSALGHKGPLRRHIGPWRPEAIQRAESAVRRRDVSAHSSERDWLRAYTVRQTASMLFPSGSRT